MKKTKYFQIFAVSLTIIFILAYIIIAVLSAISYIIVGSNSDSSVIDAILVVLVILCVPLITLEGLIKVYKRKRKLTPVNISGIVFVMVLATIFITIGSFSTATTIIILIGWMAPFPLFIADNYKNKQTEQAEVIEKKKEFVSCTVAFKLSDGTIKEFTVNSKIFKSMQIDDSGKLSYKEIENIEEELKNGYRLGGREFINFDKNNTPCG